MSAPEGLLYRSLNAHEIDRKLFAFFERRQSVTQCWRKIDGVWQIREVAFIDDWNDADYAALVAHLVHTAMSGGFVLGAFAEDALKGFASVEPGFFGSRREYLDLSELHVSRDMRNRGVGRELFSKAASWAKSRGAEKLYISAHSSVESQAFYRAMGCVEAAEYDKAHVEKEPFDCQLEYSLSDAGNPWPEKPPERTK